MGFCDCVDVFQGCDEIALPKPEGIAAAWHFIKAITGNTSPAAVLPFGKLSAGCFCGGYPTGYGDHLGNSSPDNLRRLSRGIRCFGFSHLNQSGTGALDIYYNYAVVTPVVGDLAEALTPRAMSEERAEPGYYAVSLDNGVSAALTVTPYAALHRYVFPRPGRLVIDFSNDGFVNDDADHRGYSAHSVIEVGEAPDCRTGMCARAEAVFKGVKLYFFAYVPQSGRARLWRDYLPQGGARMELGEVRDNFGAYFDIGAGTAELRMAVSTVSARRAQDEAFTGTADFDTARAEAKAAWEAVLSRADVEFDAEDEENGYPKDQLRIFYSNLYHSLTKPSDWSGESFLYQENDFTVDFSTLWDMYKTQLPLVFTLYPEISSKIVGTFVSFCRAEGNMPHTLTLSTCHRTDPSKQARMLAEHSIYDAYVRGIDFDRIAALDAAKADLHGPLLAQCTAAIDMSPAHPDYWRLTHIVDVSQACAAMAAMAREVGYDGSDFQRYAKAWRGVYGPDGLLRSDSDYYEGSAWNFSFRPLRQMDELVKLSGGKAAFADRLDRFFGYTSPGDVSARFEGYNNESDMEAQAAYWFAGRRDRMCGVIDASLRYMFVSGRGGIPGNNDSGGLSSCYVWNALGLFPLTGQDLTLIGTPRVRRAKLELSNGRTLTITRVGRGIVPRRAVFNGREAVNFALTVRELMAGGELTVEM